MKRDDPYETPQFAICVRNDDYLASLELRKAYQVLPDEEGRRRGLLRIIDESGEDYLFPEEFFMLVELPAGQTDAFLRAS